MHVFFWQLFLSVLMFSSICSLFSFRQFSNFLSTFAASNTIIGTHMQQTLKLDFRSMNGYVNIDIMWRLNLALSSNQQVVWTQPAVTRTR